MATRLRVVPTALAIDSRNRVFPSPPIPIQSTATNTIGSLFPNNTIPFSQRLVPFRTIGSYANGLPIGGVASTVKVANLNGFSANVVFATRKAAMVRSA